MIHVIRLWGWLAETTGIPFRFWLRFPSVMADLGSFFLVIRWLKRLWPTRNHGAVLLSLALCPTAILISGYHGNTDSIMIFLVLMALYTVDNTWLAGLIFGLALCVKVVPLSFLYPLSFFIWQVGINDSFSLGLLLSFLLSVLCLISCRTQRRP